MCTHRSICLKFVWCKFGVWSLSSLAHAFSQVSYSRSFNDSCRYHDTHQTLLFINSYFQSGNLIIICFLYSCMWALLVAAGLGEWIERLMARECALAFDVLFMLSNLCIWLFELWTLELGWYHVLWCGSCPKPNDVMLDMLCVIFMPYCILLLLLLSSYRILPSK